MILVTGGSGSGKSAFAEQKLCALSTGRRVYIATMIPSDGESRKKISAHIQKRAGKDFITIERFSDFGGLVPAGIRESSELNGNINEEIILPGDSVLLEDLSNLTANEMFVYGRKEDILDDIKKAAAYVRDLVIVTNEIFSEAAVYKGKTAEYMRLLGGINRELAKAADEVYEVVYGIPVCLRGRTDEKIIQQL